MTPHDVIRAFHWAMLAGIGVMIVQAAAMYVGGGV